MHTLILASGQFLIARIIRVIHIFMNRIEAICIRAAIASLKATTRGAELLPGIDDAAAVARAGAVLKGMEEAKPVADSVRHGFAFVEVGLRAA